MKVRNAINTSVVAVPLETTLSDAAKRMAHHDIHVLAVITGDGEPAGIVTDSELAATAEVANPGTTTVEAAMPGEIMGCYEDVEFEEALQVMLLLGIQHMPVFDQENRLIGFVSAQPPRHGIH
jgi:CBS domain-containing protein